MVIVAQASRNPYCVTFSSPELKLENGPGYWAYLPMRSLGENSASVSWRRAEQAYRRSDALEKRRKLMDAWSAYCEPKTSANVVQMRKQKPL
jgi:hypothetical protein